MIKLPNMLLIGATDRNVGKTTFACEMISRHNVANSVIGIKITVIKESNGKCPRGGQGCGVCSSLKGNYLITEEIDASTKKDTAQMLNAGASKVFWLRVLDSSMKEGVNALLKKIKKKTDKSVILICESNSIRKVIEPGLFIVLNNSDTDYIKPSCKSVISYADKVLSLINDNSQVDFNRFYINYGNWYFKEKATAIVLAGGESSRFGQDKSFIKINNKSLLEHITDQLTLHFDQIIIGSNSPEKHIDLGFEIIPDIKPGFGPLMGILSCLIKSKNKLNFITACDIPYMNIRFIRKLLAEADCYDIIIPYINESKIEPLFGIYNTNVIDAVNTVLFDRKQRQIRKVFKLVKTGYVKMEDSAWYSNINTRKEYIDYIST